MRIRPITDDERAGALGLVASYLSSEALMQAKLERHKSYFDFQWTLAQRIAVNARSRQSAIDAATIECLAKGLAYDLTVEQLTDLKTFVSTPSGSAFWTYNTRIKLVDCMRDPVRRGTERTIAADIKAVRSAR